MVPILPLFLTLLASAAADCTNCVHHSKASSISKASALTSGSCGYGSQALGFYGGHLAAAVPSLYNDGASCGACFQIRCSNTALCSKTGTQVILTDLNQSNTTDFALSSRAFRALANPGMDQKLLQLGLVDVEYKRISCDFKRKNMAVRVEESSKYPTYLAIKVLYQGGQTDIVAIDVGRVGSPSWSFMSRNHGAVWDTSRVPNGPLQFRFVITSGYDGKYVWAQSVLPADWKAGVEYDAGVQVTDISQTSCSPPCDDASKWM